MGLRSFGIGVILLGLPWLFAPAASAADASRSGTSHREKEGVATASGDESTARRIDGWIRQLGDESYLLREAATAHLLAAGYSARRQLEAAAEDPHPEVRARARRLVVLIDQNQFQRRLEAFAADVDGSQGLTMPGWEQFREIVGDDVRARSLFVEMQRQEAVLLRAAFSENPAGVDELLAERLSRLLNRQQVLAAIQTEPKESAPPLGSCAAVLLVGAASDVENVDRLSLHFSQLALRPPLREATATGSFRPQIRRLLTQWVLHCSVNSANLVHPNLQLVIIHRLTGALPMAVAVARGEPPYEQLSADARGRAVRGRAVLAVGRLAPDRAVDYLEPLLEDDAVCMQRTTRSAGATVSSSTVEIRDVALAVIVQQCGQELSEYGFQAVDRHDDWLFKLATLGFENDTARDVALTKWRHWREEAGTAPNR